MSNPLTQDREARYRRKAAIRRLDYLATVVPDPRERTRIALIAVVLKDVRKRPDWTGARKENLFAQALRTT